MGVTGVDAASAPGVALGVARGDAYESLLAGNSTGRVGSRMSAVPSSTLGPNELESDVACDMDALVKKGGFEFPSWISTRRHW